MISAQSSSDIMLKTQAIAYMASNQSKVKMLDQGHAKTSNQTAVYIKNPKLKVFLICTYNFNEMQYILVSNISCNHQSHDTHAGPRGGQFAMSTWHMILNSYTVPIINIFVDRGAHMKPLTSFTERIK